MTGRRMLGALLVAVSLVSFAAAVLDLPGGARASDAPFDLFVSRWASVFWMAAGCLVLAALVSVATPDTVGRILGRASLSLVAVYLALPYLAGRSAGVLLVLAAIAFAFSVLVTILGWHLLMPPRSTTRAGVV